MTEVPAPLQVRIADQLRIQIQRGELAPGDSLPTLHELTQRWACSMGPVRAAIELLKTQGLITGGRGRPAVVRTPPRQVVRSSERHHTEKNLVTAAEDVRAGTGTAEIESKVSIEQLEFHSVHAVIDAGADVAAALGIAEGAQLLRREWTHLDPASARREAWSVSHIPTDYIRANPDLFDPHREPWPGGTMHQLSTVGIEIMRIVDEVTAHMPSTADAALWELPPGVPMLHCRRISIDQHGRRVEISDADYPADRTRLDFTTDLAAWPTRPPG